MSESGWRNLSIALAMVLVILVAAGGALLLFGGRGGTTGASATPSHSATASASSSASASASPSESATASATPSASPTPLHTPAPSKTPATTYPTTSITFVGLKLDALADPGAKLRTIAFKSDGPSDIVATIKVTTPQTTARVCLKPGSGSAYCQTGSSTINFTGKASGPTGSWAITAIGDSITTPVVNLTLTWRTKAPKVTLTNFRFDGTGNTAYNGFTATVKAGGGGNLTFAFSWGTSYPWDLLVQDQTAGTNTEPTGTGTSLSHGVAGTKDHQYRITLQNTAAGSGSAVRLSGSIAWP